jgi:hypothetical protein
MVALVVLLSVYCSHRPLFSSSSSHKTRSKAAEKQATEKKHKSQMYWHKAIERHLMIPSNKKECQESTEEDSHGTLIPVSNHAISNAWLDSSSSGFEILRRLQLQQQQQQQPHLERERASNSNIRVRKDVTSNGSDGSNTDYSNLITYEGGTFYAIHSTMLDGPGATFHADIEELALVAIPTEDEAQVGDEILKVINSCPFEFQFGIDNTGFEGMTFIHDLNNDLVMLVVCQGNHCSEDKDRRKERGNGVVLVMKKETVNSNNESNDAEMSSSSSSCQWSAIRTLNLPSSAFFEGYSNIAVTPQTGHVAVASSGTSSISSSSTQEKNKVWVGKLLGRNKDGLWDVDSMEFEPDEFAVYDFPKDENCQNTFSNMKGLDWIDDKTLVTSMVDKVQAQGTGAANHSIHAFLRIPESSSSKR